jgi:hypothetical protein
MATRRLPAAKVPSIDPPRPTSTAKPVSSQGLSRLNIRRTLTSSGRQTLTPHNVLDLQRTVGNQAVLRLIQAMSQIENQGNPHEKEADQLAELFAEDAGSVIGDIASRMVQSRTSSSSSAATIAPAAEEGLQSPGRSLDPATQARYRARLGHDFSKVTVHSDTLAARSAGALAARAFTVGNDIVFGDGQYAPDTPEGKRLLTHELVHVVQQSTHLSPVVQRQPVGAKAARADLPAPRIDVQRRPDRLLVLVDGLAVAEVQIDSRQAALQLDVGVEGDVVQVVLRHQGGASLAAAPPADMSSRYQVNLREIDERKDSGRGHEEVEPGGGGAVRTAVWVEVSVVPPGTLPWLQAGIESPKLVSPGVITDFERGLLADPSLVDGVVLDPESREVIGYRQFATTGVSRFVDREGNLVTLTEVGLEQDIIDPLDLIPSPGGVAKGATGIAGKISLKLGPKLAAKKAAGIGTKLSMAAIVRMRGVNRALLRRAARSVAAEAATLVRRITQAGLDHSFDRHAAEWFGGVVTRATHFAAWRGLVERAAASRHVFAWSVGAADTIAHLAYIEGKPFVVQFAKETGELLTAFRPNPEQLGEMLRLLGRKGIR